MREGQAKRMKDIPMLEEVLSESRRLNMAPVQERKELCLESLKR